MALICQWTTCNKELKHGYLCAEHLALVFSEQRGERRLLPTTRELIRGMGLNVAGAIIFEVIKPFVFVQELRVSESTELDRIADGEFEPLFRAVAESQAKQPHHHVEARIVSHLHRKLEGRPNG